MVACPPLVCGQAPPQLSSSLTNCMDLQTNSYDHDHNCTFCFCHFEVAPSSASSVVRTSCWPVQHTYRPIDWLEFRHASVVNRNCQSCWSQSWNMFYGWEYWIECGPNSNFYSKFLVGSSLPFWCLVRSETLAKPLWLFLSFSSPVFHVCLSSLLSRWISFRSGWATSPTATNSWFKRFWDCQPVS